MRELPEHEATGELAHVYGELRRLCAVPYVSSLQRHLATMPGCLEYAWGVCGPVDAPVAQFTQVSLGKIE